jgi:hypothetical protein
MFYCISDGQPELDRVSLCCSPVCLAYGIGLSCAIEGMLAEDPFPFQGMGSECAAGSSGRQCLNVTHSF